MTEKTKDGKSGNEEPNLILGHTLSLDKALQLADMVVDGMDSNASYESIRSMKYDILDTIQSAVNDGHNHIDPDQLLIRILSLFLRNSYLGSKFPVDIINTKSGETLIPHGRKTGMSLLRRLASNHMFWAVDDSTLAKDLSALKEEVILKCEVLHHALKS